MSNNTKGLVQQLYLSDTKKAYNSLLELKNKSEVSNETYGYFDEFVKMLDNENSYIRSRGILLIASNVKWDKENKFDNIVDKFLLHVQDEKPITARQCIQSLKEIIKYKPNLHSKIKENLCSINYSKYKDTMNKLIFKDSEEILDLIKVEE